MIETRACPEFLRDNEETTMIGAGRGKRKR
jgi:hypothetical protein